MINIVKNKDKIFIGDSIFELEFDSICRIGNSNEISVSFKGTEIDMIRQRVTIVDGE